MTEFTMVAHCHDEIGEVPVWCDRTSTLWWLDILTARLHNVDPSDGRVRTVLLNSSRPGSIGLCRSGELILACAEGLFFYDPKTGTQTPFVGRERIPIADGQFFNDGRCDREGRFYVGTMHKDFRPEAVLYRVTSDGSVTPFADGIIVSNGVAFSADNTRMYFADTRQFNITTFDVDPASGALSNRTLFSDTTGRPGRPDGACVDAEGFLWSAEYAGGRIVRYAPDGSIDREVETPVSHPTSVCFGGPDRDTMFVTSGCHGVAQEDRPNERLAGALLSFKPGVTGLPEPRFDR
ncbi:SMP-30/gluconolactonase/LRE family protein [Salipiger sp.]|uniref:SMP-30/gluconolactonase/LRE family protein n=1 Tax=Salipiger sp. TaxID=2078585 RepID=UPI003A983436